jgi:hypothetical protein
VLFVDDGQLQVLELDRGFNDCMRADDDLDASIREPAPDVFFLCFSRVAD